MTECIEAALIQRQRLTRPLPAFDRSCRLLLQQFENVNAADHPCLFLFFKNRRNSYDKLDFMSGENVYKPTVFVLGINRKSPQTFASTEYNNFASIRLSKYLV